VRYSRRPWVAVAVFAGAALAAAVGACAKKAEESGVPGGALGIGGPGICPECDAGKNVIPVVYGKPGRDLIEREARGEIKLGGCCVTNESARYHCRACGLDFR
jgi:rubredoxin